VTDNLGRMPVAGVGIRFLFHTYTLPNFSFFAT